MNTVNADSIANSDTAAETKVTDDTGEIVVEFVNPEYSDVSLEEQLTYRGIAAADLIDPSDALVFSTN